MSIYRIGMEISMANNVSRVLGAIVADMGSMLLLQGKLTQGFATMNRAVMGIGAIIGGAVLAGGLSKLASHGDKLLDQQDKLVRAGMSLNDVLKLQAGFYEKISAAVPTGTAADYLKQFNDLRSVVGADKAEAVTPWSMKLEAIIANATGKSAEGEGFKLWRAMEMTGRSISDPAGTQKLADAFVKDIIGSGGKLDAQTYQTMARRGGVAWANASPEFLAGPMSVVAADLGGETAGTAMMSAYMFMTGANTLSKQQFEVMQKAHLIDPNKVTHDKGGRVNVAPGGIIGSDEFAGQGKFDLYGWTKKYLEPGLHAISGHDRAVFASLLAKVGRNRNVMRMLNMFSDTGFLEQIDKDLAQWKQAHSIDQSYGDYITNNPMGVKQAYHSQMESMLQAIGAPMMQAALPVMRSITGMFEGIGRVANANPEAIKAIGYALAGLSAGAITGGLMLIAAAIGPAGWLVLGIPALAGALAALEQPLKNLLKPLAPYVGKLVDMTGTKYSEDLYHHDQVWSFVKRLRQRMGYAFDQEMPKLPADVQPGIGAAIKGIAARLNAALSQLGASLGSALPGVVSVPGGTIPRIKWEGGAGGNVIKVDHTTVLDGRVLARSVSNHIAQRWEHARSAPYHDGSRGYADPGQQMI
jgi:hypothetical protein